MLGKCPSGKFDYFYIKVNIYWERESKLVLRFGFITKVGVGDPGLHSPTKINKKTATYEQNQLRGS